MAKEVLLDFYKDTFKFTDNSEFIMNKKPPVYDKKLYLKESPILIDTYSIKDIYESRKINEGIIYEDYKNFDYDDNRNMKFLLQKEKPKKIEFYETNLIEQVPNVVINKYKLKQFTDL